MIWYPLRPRWMNVMAKPCLLFLSTPGGGSFAVADDVDLLDDPRAMRDFGRTTPDRAVAASSIAATTSNSRGIG